MLGTVAVFCPFGELQRVIAGYFWGLYPLFLSKTMFYNIPRIYWILGASFIFTIVFGRAFCGWICPFGAILEFTGKIPNKNRVNPPALLEDRYLKYEILAVFLAASIIFGYPVFCQICPAGAFYRAIHGFGVGFLVYIALISLVTVIYLSYRYDGRVWCRNICPLGAILAILDHISALRVRIKKELCIKCMSCHNICPMKIDIIDETLRKNRDTVPTGECIRCGICVDSCPKNAIEMSLRYG